MKNGACVPGVVVEKPVPTTYCAGFVKHLVNNMRGVTHINISLENHLKQARAVIWYFKRPHSQQFKRIMCSQRAIIKNCEVYHPQGLGEEVHLSYRKDVSNMKIAK